LLLAGNDSQGAGAQNLAADLLRHASADRGVLHLLGEGTRRRLVFSFRRVGRCVAHVRYRHKFEETSGGHFVFNVCQTAVVADDWMCQSVRRMSILPVFFQ